MKTFQGQDSMLQIPAFQSRIFILVILQLALWCCATPIEGLPYYHRLGDFTLDMRNIPAYNDEKDVQKTGVIPEEYYKRDINIADNELYSNLKRRQVKLTKMLKNKLGYYLFMTPNGELKGTSDITLAQQQGVFEQDHGSSMGYVTLKSKSTQKYVVIDNNGVVSSSTTKADISLYSTPDTPFGYVAFASPTLVNGSRRFLALYTEGGLATSTDQSNDGSLFL